MWDQYRLKGALKPGDPNAYTPKSPSEPLSPNSGPTQKTF